MEGPVFYSERLELLKDLEALTQTELAEALGVRQSFISQIVNQTRPFPDGLAARASSVFKYPLTFFSVPPTAFDTAVATFRKKSAAPARAERQVVQSVREASRAWNYTSKASGFREFPATLRAKHFATPEDAASHTRKISGLPADAPIRNMTQFAENLGVGVVLNLMGPQKTPGHLGASIPMRENSRPLIALTSPTEGGRTRLTIAHELGHLLFDADLRVPIRGTRSPEENRAFDFAGALLVPEKVMRERIDEHTTMRGFLEVKADYGISVVALIVRAERLAIISADRARSLHIQLSSLGWKKSEPVRIEVEKPSLFGQAAARVWGSRSLAFKMSQTLGIPAKAIDMWLGDSGTAEPQEEQGAMDNVVSLDERRKW